MPELDLEKITLLVGNQFDQYRRVGGIEESMAQTDVLTTARGGVGVWIFRALLVAGAAFMLYSWFTPWWGANFAILDGEGHMLLRPWGVEVVSEVRANADESLYSMPWFFAPFMWTYLAVCMLALAASLFVNRQISLGPIKLPLAVVLIALVGLSYMAAVGIAYGVGELKAEWAGTNFIGRSTVRHAMTGNRFKMESDLLPGYWLALYAGGALFVVSLLRFVLVRQPKA